MSGKEIMEEKKDNKSIKDKLLQGQDSSHKKIVIKRKPSPIADTTTSNVSASSKPKKDLDVLVKEENERQQLAPKPLIRKKRKRKKKSIPNLIPLRRLTRNKRNNLLIIKISSKISIKVLIRVTRAIKDNRLIPFIQ